MKKPLATAGLAVVAAVVLLTVYNRFQPSPEAQSLNDAAGRIEQQTTELAAPSSTSSTTSSPSSPVASPSTTISYLAVRAGEPTPKDPVPVADQATMQQLIAAATANDRAKFNQIGASPSVALIPGGSIVTVISSSGGLSQVRLHTRDIKGNDLSGQVRWVDSRLIQTRAF
jgi:hypothetical protein